MLYQLAIEFSYKLAHQVKATPFNDCTNNCSKNTSLVASGPLITGPHLEKKWECVYLDPLLSNILKSGILKFGRNGTMSTHESYGL